MGGAWLLSLALIVVMSSEGSSPTSDENDRGEPNNGISSRAKTALKTVCNYFIRSVIMAGGRPCVCKLRFVTDCVTDWVFYDCYCNPASAGRRWVLSLTSVQGVYWRAVQRRMVLSQLEDVIDYNLNSIHRRNIKVPFELAAALVKSDPGG